MEYLVSDGSDDNSSILEMVEDNSFMPDGLERLKSYHCKQSSILSQILPQTIINDFYKVKEYPKLQRRFIGVNPSKNGQKGQYGQKAFNPHVQENRSVTKNYLFQL